MNWQEEATASGDFEVYPEGGYILKMREWEKTEAKSGTPQIRFHFNIVEPVNYAGKTFVDHCALTEKALWRIAKLVDRCGIATADLSEMEVPGKAFSAVLDSCKGRKVGATLIVDV